MQRFGILKKPLLLWYMQPIRQLLNCRVILHNKTVESRRDGFFFANLQEDTNEEADDDEPAVNLFANGAGENNAGMDENVAVSLAMRVAGLSESMRDADLHAKLQCDIIEHNWGLRNNV